MSRLAFLLILLTGVVRAEDPKVPFQPIRAEALFVHDADTLNVNLCLPFGVELPNRTIRAFGYDAWEVSRTRRAVKVTDAEVKKGLKARDEFRELLKTGTLYVESMEAVRIGWPQNEKFKPEAMEDLYGRLLCVLWVQVMHYPDGKPTVEWIYVPKWMEERGHLRSPRNPVTLRPIKPVKRSPEVEEWVRRNIGTPEQLEEYSKMKDVIPAG